MSDLLNDRRDVIDEYEDERAAKRLKKLEKASETRQLDPWERYRALNDLLDTYVDMMEIADRKTRFSLIILGALNALNLVVAARPTLFVTSTSEMTRGGGVYAAVYITVSLYLLVQAIDALRPRASAFLGRIEHAAPGADRLPGLRFIGDVLGRSSERYYEAWLQTEIGQLNQELALHVRGIAAINKDKYRALNRLYIGLVVLAVLTALLLLGLVFVRFSY